MKHRFLHIIAIFITAALIKVNASAESAAFGYFINESENESFDYLEKILPNSFASTLKNRYGFDVVKPAQISGLSAGENGLKKEKVREEELRLITGKIDTDYFIYGSFRPIEDNKIRLTISIHRNGTTSVFQFQETGYLETEIFKLVDKIAVQIKNIAGSSMIYKNGTVTPKSKLAILTNIEGDELNTLYYEFLTAGYRLSPVQADEINALMDDEQVNKFYHMTGANASYHLIHNRNDLELLLGTWSGTEYYKNLSEKDKVFDDYVFNYHETVSEMLKKIKALNSDAIDYIIVAGFNSRRSSVWIRCIDLKDNRLIVTESGIKGSSINEITKNIIKSITSGLPEKK